MGPQRVQKMKEDKKLVPLLHKLFFETDDFFFNPLHMFPLLGSSKHNAQQISPATK
jgi:hypothetical protein